MIRRPVIDRLGQPIGQFAQVSQSSYSSTPSTSRVLPRSVVTLFGDQVGSVSLDDQAVRAEPQDLADQAALLVAVQDDQGVDAVVNTFDGEAQIRGLRPPEWCTSRDLILVTGVS
ncbi:hypothetical protein BHQ15_17040 [Mycolicibacillus koreensis]|nr:hypothetical protein BHQ15_17040 [Mycolicibacillus koreensis]